MPKRAALPADVVRPVWHRYPARFVAIEDDGDLVCRVPSAIYRLAVGLTAAYPAPIRVALYAPGVGLVAELVPHRPRRPTGVILQGGIRG